VPPPAPPVAPPSLPSPPGSIPAPPAGVEFDPPAAPGARDGAAAARQAAADYVKAFNASDIDGVMAVCGLPWLADFKQVIEDRDALRKHFEKAVAGTKLKTEVIKATKFAAFRAQVKGQSFLAQLDAVVTPDDYVVEVGVNGVTYSAALVKIVNGRAVVVGWTT
jgi:hypothetical protein